MKMEEMMVWPEGRKGCQNKAVRWRFLSWPPLQVVSPGNKVIRHTNTAI